VFKKLANIFCWPTMFGVCELVRFLLANKRQMVRCDWLAIVNIMTQNGRMHLTVDYTNYTSPFYLYIIHDCTQTDFGRLRFHLRAIKQITAAARRRRLLSRPSPPYCWTTLFCWPTFVCRVTQMSANKCWPTNV